MHVKAADVGVGYVGFLVLAKHGDAGVSLWGEDVDEGVGVAVEGNGGGGLEKFAVQRGKDADDIVRAGGALDDPSVLIDGFHELTDHQGDGLDSLDLFLCSDKLAFETSLLVFDVFLLQAYVPGWRLASLGGIVEEDGDALQMPLQLLHGRIIVIVISKAVYVERGGV